MSDRSDRPWMADIKSLVAAHYGVQVSDMLSERRDRRIAWPRHVAMYLCSRHTGFSVGRIGAAFGNRDHTSVMYGIRRVGGRMAASPADERDIEALSQAIAEPAHGIRHAIADAAEKAARRRELFSALLRCHRRRLTRQGAALGRLEALVAHNTQGGGQ